jgi:hypothetical protein
MKVKYCEDCKYCVLDLSYKDKKSQLIESRCFRKPTYLSKDYFFLENFCKFERRLNIIESLLGNYCGKWGRFFKPKDIIENSEVKEK